MPLLTTYHLDVESPLFEILSAYEIPYEYVVMVADVEATDEVFCQKFTGGNEKEFLQRCERSVDATNEDIARRVETYQPKKLRSSSFFREFGRERFLYYQEAYKILLRERREKDGSFNMRVSGDVVARTDLYRKMYPEVFYGNVTVDDRNNFLIDRTLRTMAQYLTLGRLISETADTCFPMTICHPTRNIGMFNSRNKFLLTDDGRQPQLTIPVFEMRRKVY